MSFTVNNLIANTTATVKDNGNDTYTITLTGADGGTFDGIPEIYGFENADGDYIPSGRYATKMTVTGNTATGTIETYDSSCTVGGATFNAPVSKTLDITNQIENTESSYTVNGDNFDITVKGADGGTFTQALISYMDDSGDSVEEDMTVNGNVATYSVSTDIEAVTLIGTFTEPVKGDSIEYNLTNCTVDGEKPEKIEHGATVTIKVKANDNAKLKTLQSGYTDDSGDAIITDGVISSDSLTGTVTLSYPSGANSPYIYATAEVIEPVGRNYGAINVYLVTLDDLDAFSKKRFFKQTDSDSTGATLEEINLGEYVNRIKRIYVNVPVSGTDVIKCGNYNTGIEVKAPNTDIITVDFGEVELTGLNGDSNDYNANLSLFIPFRGIVQVNNAYVGKTVNLTVKVNIITGDGIAVLSCNGVPFQYEDITLSRNIIYRTGASDLTLIGNDNWDELNLYGFEPYFIMQANETVNKRINATSEPVTIGDVTGYAQFENVYLEQTECLTDEFTEIVSELNKGVYI